MGQYSTEDHARWAALYEAGKSFGEISLECGAPKPTVAWRLRQMGIVTARKAGRKPKYEGMTPEQISAARAQERAGKPCVECGEVGVEFYASNPYQCKVCVKAKMEKYYEEHSESIKAREKASRDPIEARAYHLEKKYDMTQERFDEMLTAQEGVCFLCKRPPRGNGPAGKVLNVDHDHQTGKVRKLLCVDCNRALGWMQDDPIMLEKAAAYIRLHREVV